MYPGASEVAGGPLREENVVNQAFGSAPLEIGGERCRAHVGVGVDGGEVLQHGLCLCYIAIRLSV